MRFVRCEACGAKALVAASQCPKCSHLLALRDDEGNTVPLAQCRVCKCYYPRSRGPCRWCVSQQPASRVPSLLAGGGAVVLLAGVTWGGWQVFGGSADTGSRTPLATAALVATAPESTAVSPPASQAPATRGKVTVVLAGVVSAPSRTVAPARSQPAVTPTPVSRDPGLQARTVAEASLAPQVPAITTGAAASLTPPPNDSLLPSIILVGDEGIARTWVNVRSGTSMGSEVVGVIQPNTRVEFGESRRSWVRVRTDRVEGWADRRLFAAAR